MHRALLLAVSLLGACTSVHTFEDKEKSSVILLRGSLGSGNLHKTAKQYNAWHAAGLQIVIDGALVSADGFAAPGVGGCYTERGSLHLHAASWIGLIPSMGDTDVITKWLAQGAPRIAADFRQSLYYYNPVLVKAYEQDDLHRLWPEGKCSPEVMVEVERVRGNHARRSDHARGY